MPANFSWGIFSLFAWLVPHVSIEIGEYRRSLSESSFWTSSSEKRSKKPETSSPCDGGEGGGGIGDDHNVIAVRSRGAAGGSDWYEYEYREERAPKNSEEEEESDRLLLAKRVVSYHSALAIAVALMVISATAATVALTTHALDPNMVSIIDGMSLITSAFVTLIISWKCPKWVGAYYCRTKTANSPVRPLGRHLGTLAFQVRWSVWRPFARAYFCLLPFYSGANAVVIECSAIAGLAFGFVLDYAVYFGRHRREVKPRSLVSFALSFVVAVVSCALFQRGARYIDTVWGRNHWIGRGADLGAASAAVWFLLASAGHFVLWRLTRRKVEQYGLGKGVTGGYLAPAHTKKRDRLATSLIRSMYFSFRKKKEGHMTMGSTMSVSTSLRMNRKKKKNEGGHFKSIKPSVGVERGEEADEEGGNCVREDKNGGSCCNNGRSGEEEERAPNLSLSRIDESSKEEGKGARGLFGRKGKEERKKRKKETTTKIAMCNNDNNECEHFDNEKEKPLGAGTYTSALAAPQAMAMEESMPTEFLTDTLGIGVAVIFDAQQNCAEVVTEVARGRIGYLNSGGGSANKDRHYRNGERENESESDEIESDKESIKMSFNGGERFLNASMKLDVRKNSSPTNDDVRECCGGGRGGESEHKCVDCNCDCDCSCSCVCNSPPPSTCALIRSKLCGCCCCCRHDQSALWAQRTRSETIWIIVDWFLWACISLGFLFFTIINIGAQAQVRSTNANLPAVERALYVGMDLGPVCAFDDNGFRSNIMSFESKDDAHRAGFKVLHCGECGECSTWDDLRLEWWTRNYLAAESARCAKKSLVGGADAVDACLRLPPIAFGPRCARCWTEDILCTKSHCAFIYLQSQLINKVGNFNVAPGEITSATCEEAHCEMDPPSPSTEIGFVRCSGATRRRMNIKSSIERPPEQQCSIVDVDWTELFGPCCANVEDFGSAMAEVRRKEILGDGSGGGDN